MPPRPLFDAFLRGPLHVLCEEIRRGEVHNWSGTQSSGPDSETVVVTGTVDLQSFLLKAAGKKRQAPHSYYLRPLGTGLSPNGVCLAGQFGERLLLPNGGEGDDGKEIGPARNGRDHFVGAGASSFPSSSSSELSDRSSRSSISPGVVPTGIGVLAVEPADKDPPETSSSSSSSHDTTRPSDMLAHYAHVRRKAEAMGRLKAPEQYRPEVALQDGNAPVELCPQMLSLENFKELVFDPVGKTVTCGAGVTVGEVLEFVKTKGYTLENLRVFRVRKRRKDEQDFYNF